MEALNILLVDDNDTDIKIAQKALRDGEVKCELSIVNDGVEAIDFLRRQGNFPEAPRPDIILLDLNMPKKDGHQTLAEIRGDADLMNIPVVILTTSDSDRDIVRAYKLHVNGYIKKPVDNKQFIMVIKTLKIDDFFLPYLGETSREQTPGKNQDTR